MKAIVAIAILAAASAGAAIAQPARDPALLNAVTGAVSETQLRASVETLVGFGTRHTMSDPNHPTRGIGAARRWTEGQFQAFSQACGGCLTIVKPSETVSGVQRIPTPTVVENVIAIQRGTSDPNRVIVISAHIDSINSNVMDAVGDAPGANDDGSGTAAVIEAARILSQHRFPATLVYAVLSGEEQGLHGGKVLADYARAQGWEVEAVLNNDIVGNSRGMSGEVNNTTVRIFSEGVRASETAAMASARRSTGGEVDSPSRNLSRFLARLTEEVLLNFRVEQIYRTDRYGRGGDHTRMQEAGFPAVRVTEMLENWDHQHQTVRNVDGRQYGDLIEYVDFAYLANVTRMNIAAMAALAMAPPPPDNVRIAGGNSPATRVSWDPTPGAAAYEVWWRSTSAPQWQYRRVASADETAMTLPGVIIDNYFFGVAAVSADGYASPVQFPGPIGAFMPPPTPTQAR